MSLQLGTCSSFNVSACVLLTVLFSRPPFLSLSHASALITVNSSASPAAVNVTVSI